MRYWYTFIYMVFISMLAAGCIKDNCKETVCANDGVCVQGNCSCPAGYEGEDCTILWVEKYTGDWQASDVYQKDTSTHNYKLSITQVTKDTFLIFGLADTINNVYCIRENRLSFKILEKAVQDSTFVITEGAATLNDSSNIVTGLYSFRLNDSNITTYFTWKK